MGRTNIEVDDELVALVMRRYRVTTAHEAVELALRRAADAPYSRQELLELRGSGWNGDLETQRSDRP